MEPKIDFCIIDNNFTGNNRDNDFWVFLTDRGLDYIDGSIREREDFKKLVHILKSRGFMEVDELRFEFIGNSQGLQGFLSDKNTIREMLLNFGAKNNAKFKNNIESDLKKLSDNIGLSLLGDIYKKYEEDLFGENTQSIKPINSDTGLILYDAMEEKRGSVKIPELREKVTMNVYLFIDVLVNDFGDLIVDLTGQFQKGSQLNDRSRTYVKISTLEFERRRSPLTDINPDIINFQTTKSKGEILKEISFLQEVSFKMMNYKRISKKGLMLEPGRQHYSILDLKDKIQKDEMIVLSIDKKDYDTMIGLSDRIEFEKEKQSQKSINVSEVISSIGDLSIDLTNKMEDLAYNEDYREAASTKKDLEYIQSKASELEDSIGMDGRISRGEFHTLLPNK